MLLITYDPFTWLLNQDDDDDNSYVISFRKQDV